MGDRKSKPLSMLSATVGQDRILDDALYSLTSQWAISDPTKAAGKREQLLLLLNEVGSLRFKAAVQETIRQHHSEFFPTIAAIRECVSTSAGKDKRTWWRDPNCPQCRGIGWVYIANLEIDRLYKVEGHRAVKRCVEPGCLRRNG